jgi:predicted phosphodiesterase
MQISRAGLLRGVFASTALIPAASLPTTLLADAVPDAFRPDAEAAGAHPWTQVPQIGGGPLRFAVIGDHTGIGRPGVFDQAMVQLSWLQPDFVMSVGDLIEGYTEDRAKIARQWAAVETSVAKLGRPFLYVQGNHDVDNAETLDAWRERRGAAYYSFTYKGALFLALNTEDTPKPMTAQKAADFYALVDLMQSDPDKGQTVMDERARNNTSERKGEYSAADEIVFGDRQLGWARDVLARHPDPAWTFVILHKPAWKMRSPDFAKVQAMLAGRNHTVFAGHTHYFTHEVIDGHDYINMGTTGGIRTQFGPGTMDHAMVVTLARTGPIYANTRLNGLMDVAGQTGQVRAY